MKIVFLCGGAFPGRNGVGDYARRLAGEFIRAGHQAAIVALNDWHRETVEDGIQNDNGTEVRVIRIPATSRWSIKIKCAEKFIEECDPEWISLQYVPFSFNLKGLPFGLVSRIEKLRRNRNLHIMFHELWLGVEKEAKLKMRIWGSLQKYLIVNLGSKLCPDVCHTQTEIYQELLKSIGVDAKYLPLFGNIPVYNRLEKVRDPGTIKIIVFGTIQYGAPIESFLEDAKEYFCRQGKKIRLVFLGRNGIELNYWLAACERAEIQTEVLGELSETVISRILNNADLGITTTPHLLCQKSGGVASMREHELPVISVAREWTPRISYKISKLANITVCYSQKKTLLGQNFLMRPKKFTALKDVYLQFLSDLEKCK